jgi:hypothetical protein
MKEKKRQRFLREMGYRRPAKTAPKGSFSPARVWLAVYIPDAVREAHPECASGDYSPWARTIESARLLGGTNIRVRYGQLVADWPQKYWE